MPSKAGFWLVDCPKSVRRCKIERAFVEEDSLRGVLLQRHRHGRCTERSATGIKANDRVAGVEGRIDHFAFDPAGERLFVCALGNNTVEVLDLRKGERVHSITGLGAPQGVGYAPD